MYSERLRLLLIQRKGVMAILMRVIVSLKYLVPPKPTMVMSRIFNRDILMDARRVRNPTLAETFSLNS